MLMLLNRVAENILWLAPELFKTKLAAKVLCKFFRQKYIGVESIAESFISIDNIHISKPRPIKEDTADD
jgi:hypothetical protein